MMRTGSPLEMGDYGCRSPGSSTGGVGQPLRSARTCRVRVQPRGVARGQAPSFDLLARTLLPHKLADARRPPRRAPKDHRPGVAGRPLAELGLRGSPLAIARPLAPWRISTMQQTPRATSATLWVE